LSDDLGPPLASGRDGDIYEYGPGKVLRRTRDGRSIEHEARIMRYVADHGYRVPVIHDVLDDGRAIVMERIEGPTLGQAIEQRPWRIVQYARLLARLHDQLHDIAAPEWLPRAGGNSVVHRDLHPLNVLMSPTGPVVIDWTNAAAGRREADVVDAWLVMAVAGPDDPSFLMRLLLKVRVLLVESFVRQFDRAALVPFLRPGVEERARDHHMSEAEVATMWRLVEKEEAKLRKRARTSAAG
jgi:aminoglycoside phosphotransferase (APT) family kinase protein